MPVRPHEVNFIFGLFGLLQTDHADGNRVLAGPPAIEGIWAGAGTTMLSKGNPVLYPIALLYQGVNLNICLSGECNGEAPILQGLGGLVVTVDRGVSQG